jgi:hypothetical protein
MAEPLNGLLDLPRGGHRIRPALGDQLVGVLTCE